MLRLWRFSGLLAGAALLIVLLTGFVSNLPVQLPQSDPESFIFVLDGSPVHDVGELLLHMSNWGSFGSWPGAGESFSFAPSGEWPAGSGIEHVYVGGLWVGALRSGVPAVSTAAYEVEFRPNAHDLRDIVYRSEIGATGGVRFPWAGADDDNDGTADEEFLDGYDNDGDGLIDEDFAAISDQMFSRKYRDDEPEATQIYPGHHPLGLEVQERSYQWADDEFDDFIGIDYHITNVGSDPLDYVFVGIFLDGDIGNRNTPDYGADDVAGYKKPALVCTPYGGVTVEYGYMAEWNNWNSGSTIAVMLLDQPTDPTGDKAPKKVRWSSFLVMKKGAPFEEGGDPTNDFERFELLSSGVIFRDRLVPGDYRILLSAGPFDHLNPGESIDLSIALVCLPSPDDNANATSAAVAYRGKWVDADSDPATGVLGRETPVQGPASGVVVDACQPPYDQPIDIGREVVWINADCAVEDSIMANCGYSEAQEEFYRTGVNGKETPVHWVLPGDEITTPVAITRFGARLNGRAVQLEWETWSDEAMTGYDLLRAMDDERLTTMAEGIPAGQHVFIDDGVAPGRRYTYQLVAHGADGGMAVSQRASVFVPRLAFALDVGVPNPFRHSTTIRFTVAEPSSVDLSVFDAAGRRVTTLSSRVLPTGTHEVVWDGTNQSRARVSAGVYFVRLKTDHRILARKLVLVE